MSFGFTGSFRQGAWRDFRYFLLHSRRDAVGRVAAIRAELSRIGYVRVLYARRDPNNENSPMTEMRVGLDVSAGSSLEKLLQAYIATGGNPFDISMFLTPDSYEVAESSETAPDLSEGGEPPIQIRETEPYSGSSYSGTADPFSGGVATGGWLPMWRYPPRRTGGAAPAVDEHVEVHRAVDASRRWISAEIRTLRNDLEARILKLCDLREQLKQEMDEVLPAALGGSIPDLPYAEDQFAASTTVPNLVDQFDAVFYPVLDNGDYDWAHPNVSTPNPSYPTLLDDAPGGEEDWTALG